MERYQRHGMEIRMIFSSSLVFCRCDMFGSQNRIKETKEWAHTHTNTHLYEITLCDLNAYNLHRISAIQIPKKVSQTQRVDIWIYTYKRKHPTNTRLNFAWHCRLCCCCCCWWCCCRLSFQWCKFGCVSSHCVGFILWTGMYNICVTGIIILIIKLVHVLYASHSHAFIAVHLFLAALSPPPGAVFLIPFTIFCGF